MAGARTARAALRGIPRPSLFWLLPLGLAFAFLGVQLAVFGLYMGAAFAPNHIGMPIVPRDGEARLPDQAGAGPRETSPGAGGSTTLMGGLNYQIEHHLFPSMPRRHLAAARRLTRSYCHVHAIPYTETTLLQAWGTVITYLNQVGIAADDTFRCPTSSTLR